MAIKFFIYFQFQNLALARGERDENLVRLAFTPEEIVLIGRAVAAEEKRLAKRRQRKHGGTAPGKHSGKVSTSDAGKTRDKIGAAVGVSGKTYEKMAAVVDAAEIRFRAERRLGAMLSVSPKNAGARGVGKSGVPPKYPTYKDAGIDKKLSSRSQKLAAVPEAKFEGMIGEWREMRPKRLSESHAESFGVLADLVRPKLLSIGGPRRVA